MAGFNVTATAKRGDMRLIAVILGAPSNTQRFAQAARVDGVGLRAIHRGLAARSDQPLPVHVQVHEGPQIQPVAASDLKLVMPKADAQSVRLVYDVPPAINGPVTTGEPLGRVIVQEQGQQQLNDGDKPDRVHRRRIRFGRRGVQRVGAAAVVDQSGPGGPMKVASKQRNRRNRKLARKKKSDPHQAKSRLRKMRRTRIRGK